MSKAGAFLTLVGCLGLAIAYALPWDSLLDQRKPFSPQLDFIMSPPAREEGRVGIASEGWRTFARKEAPSAAAVAPPSMPRPVVAPLGSHSWEPVRQGPTSASADRASLTRELQRELKRVGCYDGEISGVWTQSTRNAMRAFTGRINATLPFEEPDGILLALAQGHKDKACGMPCPAGQGQASDGRCLPNAILVHSKKVPTAPVAVAQRAINAEAPATPAITGWATTTIAAPPASPIPPPEGRMALAGPPDPAQVPPEALKPGEPPASTPAVAQARDVSKRTGFGPRFFRQLDRMGNN